jgi:hypothetical protein
MNKVHHIFEEVLESVSVDFFSREDYKKANMKWIKRNWGPSHVEAFLAVTGFHKYVPVFRDNGIDGRNLLKLHSPATLTQYLEIPADDAEHLAQVFSSNTAPTLLQHSSNTPPTPLQHRSNTAPTPLAGHRRTWRPKQCGHSVSHCGGGRERAGAQVHCWRRRLGGVREARS